MSTDSTNGTGETWRRQKFFSRLRVRLLLLVLLAVLPVLGLLLYSGYEQLQTARRQAVEEARRLVRLAANTQRQHIESSRQLLATLSQLNEVHPERAEECSKLFASLLRVHKVYANIGAIDTNGYSFASAVPAPRLFLGDRSYYTRARDTGKFALGEFQKGRITEKYTLNMAYPLRDRKTHQPLGVLYAALDLGWLNQFANREELQEGTTLTVIDREGTILLRYQQPDLGKSYIGHSMSNHPSFMRLLKAGGEFSGESSGLDGVRRLYSSSAISRTAGLPDAFVFVGIPVQAAYGAAQRMLFQNVVVLLIVAALALGAAWTGGDVFVLRQVRGLVNAAQRMRQGDLSARSGVEHSPGELGTLARSFDEMAATLEAQVLDLKATHAELKSLNEELEARVLERTTELKRSNEDLEQFAYVASHDLQEPLRMVNNYVQLVRQRYGDKLDDSGREFLDFALDGAVRMQQLILDLLAYSRIGRQGRQFARTDVQHACARALANLKVAIEESRAEIIQDPLPTVFGDLTLLTQLFQNLIGNGLKFRGERPPRIEVRVVRQGADWHFSIADNGIGIAPQDFERIFIVFQRLHGREKYPGTGIGLSVCKKIVERHGGRIWVESRLGLGTTFHFTLPALADDAA